MYNIWYRYRHIWPTSANECIFNAEKIPRVFPKLPNAMLSRGVLTKVLFFLGVPMGDPPWILDDLYTSNVAITINHPWLGMVNNGEHTNYLWWWLVDCLLLLYRYTPYIPISYAMSYMFLSVLPSKAWIFRGQVWLLQNEKYLQKQDPSQFIKNLQGYSCKVNMSDFPRIQHPTAPPAPVPVWSGPTTATIVTP